MGSPAINYTVTAYNIGANASTTVNIAVVLSGLSNLTISAGALSPSFDLATFNYKKTVASSASSITVTAAANNPGAIITVNGNTVASESASPHIPLSVGLNTINVVVTEPDSRTETYTLTLNRADPSNANLFSMKVSSGDLSPVFASGTTGYSVAVGSTPAITVTPRAEDAAATITVNGASAVSGKASSLISLSVGRNDIPVVVTAGDGVTSQTYTISAYRGSKNAALRNLTLTSPNTYLTPTFNYQIASYTATVAGDVSTIALHAPPADPAATVTINGTMYAGNTTNIPLTIGQNTVNISVTAPNGYMTHNYTVVITRASSVATLSALSISFGVLSPDFASGIQNYSATVAASVNSVTITPTTTDPNATVFVNGISVTSGAASQAINLTIGKNTITVQAPAQDGTTLIYTINVYKGSPNAALNNLKVSSGTLSPAFNYQTPAYSVTVSNDVSSITVTPTAADADAAIKVNGAPVASNSASQAIILGVGNNTITLAVAAQDGLSTDTYTINVNRAASPIATLSSLTTSNGNLSPAFKSGTYNYVLTVAASAIELTPTLTDAGASVKINGTAVANGSASAPIPLSTGQNTVSIVVTAQDGTTTETYTVTVYQGSTNDALSNLKLSSGTLSPAFNYQTTTYSATVATNVTSVTPTAADANATITINGVVVASNSASTPISLAYGNNPITVVVTAQNGFSVDTYTINVNRVESAVATLSNMDISSGTLSPAFASGNNDYSVILPASITILRVTPTLTDASASVKVNGTAVADGITSAAIPLNNGKNTITVAVTAQDGFYMDSYTITVYKGATNDALNNLKLSNGTLSPDFNYQTTAYSADVDNTISSITITPTAADANAAITVNGTPVASNAASQPVSLVVGANPIIITVTAQNGTTSQSYDVVVSRAAASANSVYQPVGVEKPTESLSIAEDGILVHQGISPNGDGINDFLQIKNISQYPDNKLTIMNRNGQLVYEATGYDNSSKIFDGHSNKNGQMQLPGTYFYQLDYTVNGTTKHKTGFIVLKY